MDFTINTPEDIWTADDQKLGIANAYYHRLDGVDPDLQYYASYLLVQNFELGDDYYIPTDFIAGRDEKTGHIVLKKTFQEILHNTWTRMPEFILHGNGRIEKLSL